MTHIVALESHNSNGKVTISDSEGLTTTSRDLNELLSSLVAPYENCLKVVWDMEQFLKPIVKLLPKDVVKKLNNGERVRFGDFKLFYGIGKGAVFGVDWTVREHDKSNFYTEDKYESNIYELKLYYPNEAPTSLDEVRAKGQFLIDTLQGMGMSPTKLTSTAAIYEECVLRNMNLYTIFDIPEEALEMAEWAANYCREWRTTYKLGHFDNAYDYDLSAAYASVLTKIPDFKHAKYIKTDGRIPKGIFWGILKGEVDITANISHMVSNDGKCYKGKYPDFATTTDIAILNRWGIGTFKATAGWFVRFDKLEYPFDKPMRHLYSLRSKDNELQDRLAKNMAASTWGRFIQMIGDWFGDYYIPPIASMVTSKVRCMDCDFIYKNQLIDSIISVTVDGCLSTKKAEGISEERRFGDWRLNGKGETLVMGQGLEWLLDKKPLNRTLKEMVTTIKAHTNSRSYFGLGLRFIEQARHFDKLPRTGNDILAQIYDSTPIDITASAPS